MTEQIIREDELRSNLVFLRDPHAARVIWSNDCLFGDLIVERSTCERVELAILPAWLSVLAGHELKATSRARLTLERRSDGNISLTFETIFLLPETILLSPETIRKMERLFAELLVSEFACDSVKL